MKIFLYALNVKATKGTTDHGKYGESIAMVLVRADTIEAGQSLAFAYVMDLGWAVESVAGMLEQSPAMLQRQDKDIQALFRQLQQSDVAGMFAGYPTKTLAAGSEPEIRALGTPLFNNDEKTH